MATRYPANHQEARLGAAKDKAGALVQLLQEVSLPPASAHGQINDFEEVPDPAPPAGMGSFTDGDRVIAAAYELVNECSGQIPTATRGLRAFMEETREELKRFDRTPPTDSTMSEKVAAHAILTNIENSLQFLEMQAAQLEKLQGFFKDIIYC